MRALLLGLLMVVAPAAWAGDAEARELLAAGWQAASESRPTVALGHYQAAWAQAFANYLKLEAASQIATLPAASEEQRQVAAAWVGHYFRLTPPRWLSNEARHQVAAQLAGASESPLPAGGQRRDQIFADPRVGTGFQGRRFSWLVALPEIPAPPPADDATARAVQDDDDRLLADSLRTQLSDGRWALVDPRHGQRGVPAAERLRWRFDRCLLGYTYEPLRAVTTATGGQVWRPLTPWYRTPRTGPPAPDALWRLRFRVFYPSPLLAGGVDHGPLAVDLLDALLRCAQVAGEYLQREHTNSHGVATPLNVWLTPNVADVALHAGGERWLDNLYFYQANTPREPGEWLREVAHEYAHAVMPRIGRYTETQRHEIWMDGPAGERLLLGWLAENLRRSPTEPLPPWPAALRDGDYLSRYLPAEVEPMLALWLRDGLWREQQIRRDDTAADWLLGFLLWVAGRHPPEFVLAFFRDQPGNQQLSAGDLLRSYQIRVRSNQDMILLPGGGEQVLPPGKSLDELFYLPAGRWSLGLRSPAVGTALLSVDGSRQVPVAVGPNEASSEALGLADGEGWHRLRITAGETALRPARVVYRQTGL